MIQVTGHRGVRVGAAENTFRAFQLAVDLGVDAIETDVHLTKDFVPILMHDHTVDRTTNGHGLIYEKSLEEIKVLDAAHGTSDPQTQVPTLREFLTWAKQYPRLEFNFELKDYPAAGEERSWSCADQTIEMVEEFGLRDRCVLNSFSGRLLEYIVEKYPGKYRIHAFHPRCLMVDGSIDPREYAYCACLLPESSDGRGGKIRENFEVCPESWYDELTSHGVQPWLGTNVRREADLVLAAERGGKMICVDDPRFVLEVYRRYGLHA